MKRSIYSTMHHSSCFEEHSCQRTRKHFCAAMNQWCPVSTTDAFKVTLVVISYWTVSITLVFANKYLVGSNSSAEDVSLFVAWIQCIITVLVVFCINIFKAVWRRDSTILHIPLGKCLTKPVLMLTCSYVGMLTFNNLCLRHVGISFYQVARSLTLIFVVIFSLTILKKHVSKKVWLCCLTVAGGFILGVDQESLTGTLSINGLIFGVITSLFVSLNGIFTKSALDAMDHSSVQLTLVNNINAVIGFLPLVLITGQVETVWVTVKFHTLTYWGFLGLTGVLCFAIAWISAIQIDITSPVTHHISANSKAVFQTLIAVLYNKEHKALLWWVSVVLVVGGALCYALVRIHEDKPSTSNDRLSNCENQLLDNSIKMNGHITKEQIK